MSTTPDGRPLRGVHSFVRRGSRLSPSRQDAWDRLHERWVLDLPRGQVDTAIAPGTRLDPPEIFGRTADLVVEIGAGQGETVARAATARPDRDHLALEVWRPGLATALARLEAEGAPANVRLLEADAQQALPELLAPGTVAEIWIFFPDPWHKTRHRKRRLINPGFVGDLVRLLRPQGVLRFATDWDDYARHAREVLDAEERLRNCSPTGWAPRFELRPLTSFERKARDSGRRVLDLAYQRR